MSDEGGGHGSDGRTAWNEAVEALGPGWLPSVPLPLYVRSWRTWFRWRYQCVTCGDVFHYERLHRAHWLVKHARVRIEKP